MVGTKSSFRGSRKAQAAGAAAVLLMLIMILMIGYVVVIEPDERAALLGEDFGSSSGSNSDSDDAGEINGEILLEETPGTIKYLSQDEVEHTLASVNIFTSLEDSVLAEKESIYMKNSMFSEEKGSFSLGIDDLGVTSDLVLSLRVAEVTGGRLQIEFNGEKLLDESVSSGQNINLEIADHLLLEENSIVFSLSGPGAIFWSSNEASLENIKIIGELLDLSSRSASGTFQISETEYDNLETLEFNFQSDCAPSEDGKLTIFVNNEEIYSATPNCDAQMGSIELSTSLINLGQNTVEFSTVDGDYTIYGIKVVSKLEDIEYPTYYFSLSLEEFEEVDDGDDRVELTLDFSDEGDTKRGYVSINGYKRSFDTTSSSYAFDISEYIDTGNNAVKIIPTRTLDVRQLTVEIG